MGMIEKVSHYCKTLINRLNQPTNPYPLLSNTLSKNLVSANGHIIFNPSRNGFYSFKDDANNHYYITNIKNYLPILKERQHIHVVLEVFSGVENVERWGKTAQLYAIKPIF